MGEEFETTQSEWNFDGAENELIFALKLNIATKLRSWNLEGAFWDLRSLKIEIDSKLGRAKKKLKEYLTDEENAKPENQEAKSEKQECDELLVELEEIRAVYVTFPKPSEAQRVFFLKELENFYMHLCRLMKIHGMYFRDGGDSKPAVLRR
jgi:hypothetical protein